VKSVRKMIKLGLNPALALAILSLPAFATVDIPELDPGTVGGALTLLAGALFILRDRKSRK